MKRILQFLILTLILSFISNIFAKQEEKSTIVKNTIAVVNFVNVAKVKDYTHLSISIADSVVTSIAHTGDFDLIPRNAVEKAMRRLNIPDDKQIGNDDILRLGKELEADGVIYGNYTIIGQDIRIDSQIINIISGKVVGGASENGVIGAELFDMLDLIAEKLKKRLQQEMGPAAQKVIYKDRVIVKEKIVKVTEPAKEKKVKKEDKKDKKKEKLLDKKKGKDKEKVEPESKVIEETTPETAKQKGTSKHQGFRTHFLRDTRRILGVGSGIGLLNVGLNRFFGDFFNMDSIFSYIPPINRNLHSYTISLRFNCHLLRPDKILRPYISSGVSYVVKHWPFLFTENLGLDIEIRLRKIQRSFFIYLEGGVALLPQMPVYAGWIIGGGFKFNILNSESGKWLSDKIIKNSRLILGIGGGEGLLTVGINKFFGDFFNMDGLLSYTPPPPPFVRIIHRFTLSFRINCHLLRPDKILRPYISSGVSYVINYLPVFLTEKMGLDIEVRLKKKQKSFFIYLEGGIALLPMMPVYAGWIIGGGFKFNLVDKKTGKRLSGKIFENSRMILGIGGGGGLLITGINKFFGKFFNMDGLLSYLPPIGRNIHRFTLSLRLNCHLLKPDKIVRPYISSGVSYVIKHLPVFFTEMGGLDIEIRLRKKKKSFFIYLEGGVALMPKLPVYAGWIIGGGFKFKVMDKESKKRLAKKIFKNTKLIAGIGGGEGLFTIGLNKQFGDFFNMDGLLSYTPPINRKLHSFTFSHRLNCHLLRRDKIVRPYISSGVSYVVRHWPVFLTEKAGLDIEIRLKKKQKSFFIYLEGGIALIPKMPVYAGWIIGGGFKFNLGRNPK